MSRSHGNEPDRPEALAGAESLLTGENAAFVDAWYRRWLDDPSSVEPAWARFFERWGRHSHIDGMGRGPTVPAHSIFDPPGPVGRSGEPPAATSGEVYAAALRQARIARLIHAYRVRGHVEAQLDPLKRRPVRPHPELSPSYYGLSEADLDVEVSGHGVGGVGEITTARKLLERLRAAYCQSFGVEFMHIGDPDKKRWIQERMETLPDRDVLDRDQELQFLRWLSDAENFERMLHARFLGTKRFSLEGGETLIPLLHLLIEHVAARGVRVAILGMAHRGRLNVLANILGKPVRYILAEFEDVPVDTFQGSGDVKYHLGYSAVYTTRRGDELEVSLTFNPSHLEAVDPVVEGRARARQDRRGAGARDQVLPILIHGDAAFAGQGLVAETLNLSQLRGYTAGGTIHIIVNNQIGFTTTPEEARSTPYATDVARMLAVPIFHVNGEDPEAVAAVAEFAAEWRQTFHEDVVVDMYCYRKWGHNEADEPSFTQPLLYEAIRNHPSPREMYAKKMVEERQDLTQKDVDAIYADSKARLQAQLEGPDPEKWDSYVENPNSEVGRIWRRYRGSIDTPVDTRFPRERLVELLVRANTLPEGFQAHRKVKRLLAHRLAVARGEEPVDWAVGEQAAFATLVDEGWRVRLSGQDSGRGTFSQRHATITDIVTGVDYQPLAHLRDGQGPFEVWDSMLSEAAVLGFEYGYALDTPDALVLWEAQFGDFANGAQVIIDNFIMSGEQKWNRNSGVVMLLPHGYEGQGPEHSSARVERYLQLCAEDNVFVCNCTTPANFFHLLRRQVLLPVRKPLIVMTPKSLLRHKECVSTLDELADGAFHKVLDDPELDDPSKVRRLLFCSGKVFYDLIAARRKAGEDRLAIVRLEQLYPFPVSEIRQVLERYPEDAELVWCQEEPHNMGPWPMLDNWFGQINGGIPPRYIGRRPNASPATGSPSKHREEQAAVVREALDLARPEAR